MLRKAENLKELQSRNTMRLINAGTLTKGTLTKDENPY
jgi:hypothetical protein